MMRRIGVNENAAEHLTAARTDVERDRSPRPIRVGISACLLGRPVRFDGGHKRDVFLTETFGRVVEWVPVCPEVECGFGTPREAMRLTRVNQRVRLLTVKTGVDVTAPLERFSQSCMSALARENLAGYVLKKGSPSCGLERVKVYDRHGTSTRTAASGLPRRDVERRYVGTFMQALTELATPRRHVNVLQHMAGYFKDRLDAASKNELADTIADYGRGLVPLVVPVTLFRHHVRTFDVRYLAEQAYLQPHPKELMLRNHV